MPVHAGHLALINFAARQCDELIVSLSYTPYDPIPANLRIAWMKEISAYAMAPARVALNIKKSATFSVDALARDSTMVGATTNTV